MKSCRKIPFDLRDHSIIQLSLHLPYSRSLALWCWSLYETHSGVSVVWLAGRNTTEEITTTRRWFTIKLLPLFTIAYIVFHTQWSLYAPERGSCLGSNSHFIGVLVFPLLELETVCPHHCSTTPQLTGKGYVTSKVLRTGGKRSVFVTMLSCNSVMLLWCKLIS